MVTDKKKCLNKLAKHTEELFLKQLHEQEYQTKKRRYTYTIRQLAPHKISALNMWVRSPAIVKAWPMTNTSTPGCNGQG